MVDAGLREWCTVLIQGSVHSTTTEGGDGDIKTNPTRSAGLHGVFLSRRLQSMLSDAGAASAPDDGEAKYVTCEALLWTNTDDEAALSCGSKWVSYVWFYGTRPPYIPWLRRDVASLTAGRSDNEDGEDDDDGDGKGSADGRVRPDSRSDGLFSAEAAELASDLLRKLVQGWVPLCRSLRFVDLPAVAESSSSNPPALPVEPLRVASDSGWVDLGGRSALNGLPTRTLVNFMN